MPASAHSIKDSYYRKVKRGEKKATSRRARARREVYSVENCPQIPDGQISKCFSNHLAEARKALSEFDTLEKPCPSSSNTM